jgi:hypothetical protein
MVLGGTASAAPLEAISQGIFGNSTVYAFVILSEAKG